MTSKDYRCRFCGYEYIACCPECGENPPAPTQTDYDPGAIAHQLGVKIPSDDEALKCGDHKRPGCPICRGDVAPAAQQDTDELRLLKDENARLKAQLNNPLTDDFVKAVIVEAAHQRERWATTTDEGKTDADWFWLIGYLAGKALTNPLKDGDMALDKRLHRIITVAAAACNWHSACYHGYTDMRPGIAEPKQVSRPDEQKTEKMRLYQDMAVMTELCEAVHYIHGWMDISGPSNYKGRYLEALEAYRNMVAARASDASKGEEK